MDQDSFSIAITTFFPLIHLTILLLFLLPKTCLSVHPQFTTCVPKTCGDGQNISFPFWIQDRQESYCGYPRFNLSCNNNGHPLLKIASNNYIVQRIFYNNQSVRIANAEFFDLRNTCFLPVQNLSLLGNRFIMSPNYTDLFFYSNCSSSLPRNLTSYEVACSADNRTGSVLAMFGKDLNLGYASETCERGVVAPVELYGDERNESGEDWEYYNEVLRRGFVLKWIATNCSRCESTGGRCGFDENLYQFRCYCTDRPHACCCASTAKNHKVVILATVIPTGALVICLLIFLCRKKWKSASSNFLSRNISADPSSKSDLERGTVYFGVPVFSYGELEEATNNFDPTKELGDGGFGTVYHGKLQDGREVAVKRLYEHNYKRVEQFMNEVEILTRLRHKNLVSLYGCTSRHSRELLLVYEFIPNGTVADHLHGDRAKPCSLTWSVRMSIAIETADALAYLHASDTIHRDVKTTNILLDHNFSVKVADFGISRLFPTDVTHVSTAPQGTPGYVDPEYHQCYQLTDRSDVYSFGVVLIELISSLPAVDISRHRQEINLANLAKNKIQKRAFSELVDPGLGFESNLMVRRMTTSVAELAFRCLQQDKEMRPSMDEVFEVLKGIESEKYEVEKEDALDDETRVLKSIRPPTSPVSDDAGVLKSIRPPTSPVSDDAGLLKNMQPLSSPNSVTEKWVSRSTTPSAST